MALLALGATYATIERFGSSAAYMPVMLLHAFTYAALYVLFVAVALHPAKSQSVVSLNAVAFADIALSTLPIFIAVRHIAAAARGV